jgi:glycosyltransferase involved in cell wall biosynthesis
VHLAVVGKGDRRDYELDGQVHFLGATAAPEELFPEADVLFSPTREDVWGVVLIEAMAAGVPVVTTTAAGASSAVRSAGAGVVVPPGSVPELREALADLLADPQRRRELGRRGRQAADRFGVGAFADRVLQAYERALSRRPAR